MKPKQSFEYLDKLPDSELRWVIGDSREAAFAAEEMERLGERPLREPSYYHAEADAARAALRRRGIGVEV